MQNAQKVYRGGGGEVAFVQTSGKLVFSGDSFSPTRGYLYLADVWGHFLIATNGGQERKQVLLAGLQRQAPTTTVRPQNKSTAKGLKTPRLKEQKDSVCGYKLKCLSIGLSLGNTMLDSETEHWKTDGVYNLYNSTNGITLNALSFKYST